MSAARKFFIGGNWKTNGTKASIKDLVEKINAGIQTDKAEVIVAPPPLYLDYTSQLVKNGIQVSAQNAWSEPKGAFTGEISAEMIKDLGINWVILGHSERRSIFHESNELVGKKTAHALQTGLGVILCVGEQLSEREENRTFDVIYAQLDAVAAVIKDWSKVVIAYEPVWAIGTGKTASPAQAQEVHHKLRSEWLAKKLSGDVAAATRIIYGGSVKADNANELASQADVDGFLVGGASLVANDFIAIVASAAKKQ